MKEEKEDPEKPYDKVFENIVDVYDFLQGINFEVDVKPGDKRFKNLTVKEYEELIEFLKHPNNFVVIDENGTKIWREGKKLSDKLFLFIFDQMKEKIKEMKKKKTFVGKIKNMFKKNSKKDKIKEDIENKNTVGYEKIENELIKEEFKKLKFEDLFKLIDKEIEVCPNFDEVFKELKRDFLGVHLKMGNCFKLKDPLLNLLQYEDENDPMHKEFRGRMGAQILSSVYNAKKLTSGNLIAFGASLVVAGSIAYGLDTGFGSLIKKIKKWTNLEDLKKIKMKIKKFFFHFIEFFGAILYSIVPFFGETVDSDVLKAFLHSLQNSGFLFSDPEAFKETNDEAMKAGLIASVGSILFNLTYISLISTPLGGYVHIFRIIFNQIATPTSGSMVAYGYNEWRDHQRVAVFKLQHENFLKKPDIYELVLKRRKKEQNKWSNRLLFWVPKGKDTKVITQEEKDNAYREYLEESNQSSMDIQNVSALTVNSMAVGSVLSHIAYGGITYFGYRSHLDEEMAEKLTKVVSIIVNTPTEIISLTACTFAANHLGLRFMENWFSTDDMKNEKMLRLIIDRSIKQMDHQLNEFQPISVKEVYEIYHTSPGWMYTFGRIIVKALILMFNGLGLAPTSLFEQLDISKLTIPEEVEEERVNLIFSLSYLPEDIEKVTKMPGIDEENFVKYINEIAPYLEKSKMTLTESHHYMNILSGWIKSTKDDKREDKKGKKKEFD
ncbi:hypothetical protein ACQ4LE_009590, partial [Meloidogyne hapla]